MSGRLRLDQTEFTRYLIAEGYTEPDARALVDGALEDDDAEQVEIRDRNGETVTVEVDASFGFAGLVEFVLPGGGDDPECE